MSNVNIPSSLNTTTQIPVVSKTYKLSLSELTTVTTEQAFTYYAGMRVDVAENNKQYIWKETVVGETPISNIYQYPSNHIAGGYDYSNKSFAFYEVIVESTDTPPVEDTRTIYKTEIYNVPYTGIPTMINETYTFLQTEGSFPNPDEDNVQLSQYGIAPISSNTLRVFRATASIHNPPGMTVPVRIEMYPELPNAAIVGEGGQYDTVEEAVNAGVTDLVILPGSHLITDRVPQLPPGSNVLLAPGNHVLDPDYGVRSLFSDGNNSLIVSRDAVLDTSIPIANITQSSNLSVRGEGSLIARNTSLLRATNINPAVGAARASSLVNIDISGVDIEVRDAKLAEISNNVTLKVNNANLTSYNNILNIIDTSGANVILNNIDIHAENGAVSSIISVSDSGNIELKNVDISGTLDNVVNVDDNVSSSLDIKVNNIDVTNTTFRNIVGTTYDETPISFDKISINNVVKDNVGDVSNIDNVITNNISSTTTPQTATSIPLFKNKADASAELPPYSLFINQNEDTDPAKWSLDFTT